MQLNLFLGGTFNPVHLGHIYLATIITAVFKQEVYWLPCGLPIHKPSLAIDIKHRLAMLELVIQANSLWRLDLRELAYTQPQPSYYTFANMEPGINCLVIGSDSLLDLANWHDWQQLATCMNFIVVPRDNNKIMIPDNVRQVFQCTSVVEDLYKVNVGNILILDYPAKMISSTQVRKAFVQDLTLAKTLVPSQVFKYILEYQLY